MRYIWFIAPLLFFGCIRSQPMIPIDYSYVDIPEEKRLELNYRNNLDFTVCIYPSSWPNHAGKMHFASQYVAIVINEERYPLVDTNMGYCPGCRIYVTSGEEIIASIPYSDFKIPDQLIDAEKILDFSPSGHKCRKIK